MFVFNAICSGQPTFPWKGFLCLLCCTIIRWDEISFRPGQGEIAIRDLIVAALIFIVGGSSPRLWIGNSCIVFPHKAFGSVAKGGGGLERMREVTRSVNRVAAFSWQASIGLIALWPAGFFSSLERSWWGSFLFWLSTCHAAPKDTGSHKKQQHGTPYCQQTV